MGGCWGLSCAPGRSTARPLHRCGALAAAHRGQEEVDRQGQEGIIGCSRLPPRGPLTWDLAARSGDRSARSLSSFQACATTGAAILTRKLERRARRAAANQAGRGEGGKGRGGEGAGPGRPSRTAPSARARLLPPGRGSASEGPPSIALRPPLRLAPRPQVHFQPSEAPWPPHRATPAHHVSKNTSRALRSWGLNCTGATGQCTLAGAVSALRTGPRS